MNEKRENGGMNKCIIPWNKSLLKIKSYFVLHLLYLSISIVKLHLWMPNNQKIYKNDAIYGIKE